MESLNAKGSFRSGFRTAIPFAIGTFVLAVSFGLAAQPVLETVVVVAMSVLMFAAAAQFAVLAVIATGGDVATAVAAGVLINLRFLPMSLAMTPSMPPGLLRRCLIGLTMTDTGWAMSARSNGRFDSIFLVGTFVPQFTLWQVGTIVGLTLGSHLGDPQYFGVDVLFPAFFLAILLGGEIRADRVGVTVAVLGGVIALLLVPIAPPGIPLVAASAAALIVLFGPRRAGHERQQSQERTQSQ